MTWTSIDFHRQGSAHHGRYDDSGRREAAEPLGAERRPILHARLTLTRLALLCFISVGISIL